MKTCRSAAPETPAESTSAACTSASALPRTGALAPLALVIAALFCTGVAADEVPVFEAPPSADELADILFPVRTRSIVMQDEEPLPDVGGEKSLAGAGGGDGSGGEGFGLLINFEFGKASVAPESIAALDTVGRMLKLPQAEGQAVVIEGHTDAVGGDAYNQKLSEARALAVRRYLMSVHGIEESRLHPVGRGESALHDSRDPAAAVNRRVEFRRLERQGG